MTGKSFVLKGSGLRTRPGVLQLTLSLPKIRVAWLLSVLMCLVAQVSAVSIALYSPDGNNLRAPPKQKDPLNVAVDVHLAATYRTPPHVLSGAGCMALPSSMQPGLQHTGSWPLVWSPSSGLGCYAEPLYGFSKEQDTAQTRLKGPDLRTCDSQEAFKRAFGCSKRSLVTSELPPLPRHGRQEGHDGLLRSAPTSEVLRHDGLQISARDTGNLFQKLLCTTRAG